MSKCLVRVTTATRPNSGGFIGYRLEAAVPNTAGRKVKARREGRELVGFYSTDIEAPSFRHPYLIKQSSDRSRITPADVSAFVNVLRLFHKFKSFEFLGHVHGFPLSSYAPADTVLDIMPAWAPVQPAAGIRAPVRYWFAPVKIACGLLYRVLSWLQMMRLSKGHRP